MTEGIPECLPLSHSHFYSLHLERLPAREVREEEDSSQA